MRKTQILVLSIIALFVMGLIFFPIKPVFSAVSDCANPIGQDWSISKITLNAYLKNNRVSNILEVWDAGGGICAGCNLAGGHYRQARQECSNCDFYNHDDLMPARVINFQYRFDDTGSWIDLRFNIDWKWTFNTPLINCHVWTETLLPAPLYNYLYTFDFDLDVSGLAPGVHRLNLRAIDKFDHPAGLDPTTGKPFDAYTISTTLEKYLDFTKIDLSCSLSATPSSGPAPLNNVDLFADPTGTATGNTTYKFDCTNNGTYERTVASISDDPYAANDVCSYANPGNYTAKVKVEREGLEAECTTPISVSCGVAQTPVVSSLDAPPVNWICYNPIFKATLTDPNGNQVRAHFNITGEVSDTPGNWVASGGQSCYPDCVTGLPSLEGEYFWRVYAEDNSSYNCKSAWTEYRWFGADKEWPDGDITASPSAPDTDDLVIFTATGSDALSGVKKIEIFVDGSSKKTCDNSTICSYTGGPYSAGSHTYYAKITDYSVNISGNDCNIYTTSTKSFTVAGAATTCSLTANPYYGAPPGFTSTLTATVGGTTTGEIIYQFDCTGNGGYEYASNSFDTALAYAGCPAYTTNSQAKARVTRGGVSADCSTNLYISTCAVTPNPASVLIGGTVQFTNNYDPDSSAGPLGSSNVTTSSNWTSSNTAIATVNNTTNKGLATGVAAGLALINASYAPGGGGSVNCSATINVLGLPVSNYKVVISGFNRAPTADSFSVVNSDFCGANVSYYFSWRYSDPDIDPESRFDFQIDTDSGFATPITINRAVCDLNNPSPTTNEQPVLVVPPPPPAERITYGTKYYWRVRVWDVNGANSDWLPQPPLNFTTPSHRYPVCDFSWEPRYPIAEEDVQFTDNSVCYDNVAAGSPCSTATGDSFSWTFSGGNPPSSILENPLVVFSNFGNYSATLQVRDSVGFSCSNTKQIKVTFPKPKWREVKP